MWVCDICGSHEIQVKDWINVNDRDSDCTNLPQDPIKNWKRIAEYSNEHETFCLSCEQKDEGITWIDEDLEQIIVAKLNTKLVDIHHEDKDITG